MHVALRFAYDGSQFQAYARDPNIRSVEGNLINGLRREGYVENTFKVGSRTDAGVSAAENVVSFQMEGSIKGFVHRLQSHLPLGIWALGATEVGEGFVPRYHALRTYHYYAEKDGESLAILQEACALFVGERDMTGFARVEPHRNPMRIIDQCSVEEDGAFWKFTIASQGFLWNQVRRMVDAILRVGRGTNTREDIQTTLETGVPHAKFKLASPDGLLLRSVTYQNLEWDPECGFLNAGWVPRQKAKVQEGLMSILSASNHPRS